MVLGGMVTSRVFCPWERPSRSSHPPFQDVLPDPIDCLLLDNDLSDKMIDLDHWMMHIIQLMIDVHHYCPSILMSKP
jgi:hypothetical protein